MFMVLLFAKTINCFGFGFRPIGRFYFGQQESIKDAKKRNEIS